MAELEKLLDEANGEIIRLQQIGAQGNDPESMERLEYALAQLECEQGLREAAEAALLQVCVCARVRSYACVHVCIRVC